MYIDTCVATSCLKKTNHGSQRYYQTWKLSLHNTATVFAQYLYKRHIDKEMQISSKSKPLIMNQTHVALVAYNCVLLVTHRRKNMTYDNEKLVSLIPTDMTESSVLYTVHALIKATAACTTKTRFFVILLRVFVGWKTA